jgi:hypothetical protein
MSSTFLKVLHFIYSWAFWVLLIIAIVLASSGVQSKFIYTDF